MLKYIYHSQYKHVKQTIVKLGGSANDVPDIFQDAIIIWYENVKNGRFELQSTITAYLKRVAANLWINQKKRANRLHSVETIDEVNTGAFEMNQISSLEWDSGEVINTILEELSPLCREVLIYAIYKKMSMKEIAEVLGFKNEQNVRNKKNKCLGYLRKVIENSPHYQAILKELYFEI